MSLHEPLAALGAHTVLQVEVANSGIMATSWNIMSSALSDPFNLMPII